MTDRSVNESDISAADARSARRRRGIERMGEVYNFQVGDGPGDFYGYTLEHLFGDIWEREGLSLRDRRLLLIGMMTGLGQSSTLTVQLESALDKGELSPEQLEEITIFMSHYAGWPRGAELNNLVNAAVAKHRRNKQKG